MAEKQILSLKPAPRLEQVGDEHSERVHDRKHHSQECDDSALRCESSRMEFSERTGQIHAFREQRRERFLTSEELARLGEAIREAETTGIPWLVDETKPTAKHLVKKKNRRTLIGSHAAGALRLLILTGARLREILNLRWEWVDLERVSCFCRTARQVRSVLYSMRPLWPCSPPCPVWVPTYFRRPSRQVSNRSEQALAGGVEARCYACQRWRWRRTWTTDNWKIAWSYAGDNDCPVCSPRCRPPPCGF
jgi:integrase